MLVDSHCHLDFPAFADDIDATVARAREAGVLRMLTIATQPSRVDAVRAIAERHESVFFAAGLHPCHVHEEPMPRVAELESWAQHPKMAGIGESGLDYFRHADTADLQKVSFRNHIEAARRTGLPLIVHARAADADIGGILEEEFETGPFRCVMHCYSSGIDLARRMLRLGFYLSASGNTTFRKTDAIRAAIAEAPIDRILVETDAPFLAPEPVRGKRNEPALVRHTAAAAARLYGLSAEEFATRTSENFFRLFAKVPPPESFGAPE